jgi:hypothetical protein
MRRVAKAIDIQIRRDVAPAWWRVPMPVRYYTSDDKAPADAWVIHLHNAPGNPGPPAEHNLAAGGMPMGEVHVDLVKKPDEVATLLSHEVIETFVDPFMSLFALEVHTSGNGIMYRVELCDPVEDETYPIPVEGERVMVSNFLFPAWLNNHAPKGTQFDYCKSLQRRFAKGRGYTQGFRITDVGEKLRPHFARGSRASAPHRSPIPS